MAWTVGGQLENECQVRQRIAVFSYKERRLHYDHPIQEIPEKALNLVCAKVPSVSQNGFLRINSRHGFCLDNPVTSLVWESSLPRRGWPQ